MRILSIFFLVSLSLSSFASEDFRSYIVQRNLVNTQGDKAVIEYHHQKHAHDAYLIVDKPARTATLYSSFRQAQTSIPIQVYAGDEQAKGGAGIYYYFGHQDQFHYGMAESDGSFHVLFLGSIKVPKNTVIYVLPETRAHRFRIRNRAVAFNAARVLRNRPDFNYSPFNGTVQESLISTDLNNNLAKEFSATLQLEKATLMNLLHLENDEYNMLAEFSFGVLAPETEFGSGWKYQLKQRMPFIVSLMKGDGFNTESNSRGPTQIKTIPPIITQHYKITKDQLWVGKNAAVTTLAFASDLLKEIRNMAAKHPKITEETAQDYMYYLYQGRRYEVNNATATPEKSITIQQIRDAIEHLRIEDLP